MNSVVFSCKITGISEGLFVFVLVTRVFQKLQSLTDGKDLHSSPPLPPSATER